MRGSLYLIPCPISDSELVQTVPSGTSDIALKCKVFMVENLRQARRFLKYLDSSVDIDALTFYSMGKHSDPLENVQIITSLKNGIDVGMISDAGCPAVADPGWALVEMAHKSGITVRPLVGPSSILLTLMASGMNGQQFSFHGYLPIDKKDRTRYIRDIVNHILKKGSTELFMDTPFRNQQLFKDVISSCPNQLRLCIAVDITGKEEVIVTKSIKEWKTKPFAFKKLPAMMALGH